LFLSTTRDANHTLLLQAISFRGTIFRFRKTIHYAVTVTLDHGGTKIKATGFDHRYKPKLKIQRRNRSLHVIVSNGHLSCFNKHLTHFTQNHHRSHSSEHCLSNLPSIVKNHFLKTRAYPPKLRAVQEPPIKDTFLKPVMKEHKNLYLQ